MAEAQEWKSAPLQPALRLIHCIQKERGASCALVGSLATKPDETDGSFEEQQYEENLRSARVASNSAISAFYRSPLWLNFCERNEADDFDIATMLFATRQLVDGGMGDESEYLFFHDVLVDYNTFLTSIIQVFLVDEVSTRKKEMMRKIDAPESRKNAKVAFSLLDLILSFVKLKENLGLERATLSGLMANGLVHDIDDENDDSNVEEVAKKTSNGARLNLVVNDLVMVVENQHRIMRELRKQSGLDVRGSISSSLAIVPEMDELQFDENFAVILRHVSESLTPSSAFRDLQDTIRKDFDILGFQQAMSMEEFWENITLYMNKLHAMELFLLEELENCEGSFEDFDLLSLGKSTQSPTNGSSSNSTAKSRKLLSSSLTRSKDDHERPALEEWEINLYDVEFHKRIGRGSAGTTYLGTYLSQDVAVKVAASNEMGLEGFTAELTSLKKLHHANIIRFLGAIYNPSPLTYCLVLEYCDGGDLAAALRCSTPPKFFYNVASGVARGMYYLHKMHYMHRDIKPSNVLLSGDVKSGYFVAKLTDFGLAVKVHNASVNNGKELTAETGTYRYMAPEVIRHEAYNYMADVYSFGLLLWEIIVREKPFEPKSQIEAAGCVALEGKRPPFPEGMPLTIKTLIEKCWAEKADDRMAVADIIKCLDELSGNVVAESWLSAPKGHPVYTEAVEENNSQPPPNLAKMQKKKSPISGLFRKKK